MNRILIGLNFIGVAVLALLCAIQWRVNSQVNFRAAAFERTTQLQKTELDKDQQTIKTYTTDLEDLRQRLILSEKELKELDDKLSTEIQERSQLASERDNLKTALGKWMTAITDRDKTINQARVEIQALSDDRNDKVQKLNDLTGKWNDLVRQWNDQQAKR